MVVVVVVVSSSPSTFELLGRVLNLRLYFLLDDPSESSESARGRGNWASSVAPVQVIKSCLQLFSKQLVQSWEVGLMHLREQFPAQHLEASPRHVKQRTETAGKLLVRDAATWWGSPQVCFEISKYFFVNAGLFIQTDRSSRVHLARSFSAAVVQMRPPPCLRSSTCASVTGRRKKISKKTIYWRWKN